LYQGLSFDQKGNNQNTAKHSINETFRFIALNHFQYYSKRISLVCKIIMKTMQTIRTNDALMLVVIVNWYVYRIALMRL